jgi:SiaC family regulatory phosphoprotein
VLFYDLKIATFPTAFLLPMRDLSISGSAESPSLLTKNNGAVICLEGRSTSPLAAGVFRQISLWLDEACAKNAKVSLCFEFKLDYYNTLTSRLLLDLFLKFEKMKEAGHQVRIDWHYDAYDSDLKEAGDAYATMVHVPFSFIPRP